MPVLDDVADARTGDKGNTLIIAVLPRTTANYEVLGRVLDTQAIAEHFGCEISAVTLRDVPAIEAFTVEMRGLLGGGVTGSPVLDGHGKTLSYHMLTLPIGGQ